MPDPRPCRHRGSSVKRPGQRNGICKRSPASCSPPLGYGYTASHVPTAPKKSSPASLGFMPQRYLALLCFCAIVTGAASSPDRSSHLPRQPLPFLEASEGGGPAPGLGARRSGSGPRLSHSPRSLRQVCQLSLCQSLYVEAVSLPQSSAMCSSVCLS